jgi:hypothetical protein
VDLSSDRLLVNECIYFIVFLILCVLYCFECCVILFFFVCIVLPLPPGTNPFAVTNSTSTSNNNSYNNCNNNNNNNNNNNKISAFCGTQIFIVA